MSELKEELTEEEFLKRLHSIVRHIRNVQERGLLLAERLVENGESDLARRLVQRCFSHDNDKFDKLQFNALNGSDKSLLKLVVDHHRSINRHHPEFHESIFVMSDLDLSELCIDWSSRASEAGTNLRDWIKDSAMERFDFKIQSRCYQKIKKYVDLLLDEPMKKV